MTGPSGNSEFCFPSSLIVPLGFASGNIEVSGKQNSLFPLEPVIKCLLLYRWRFSRYSAPIHWLVHGHMTCNNETVSRQMPWAGNIAKAMTSNGKRFTVTRSTVHCWPLLHVMAGISARFSNLVLFRYITNHLMTGPLGNSEFCFPRISLRFSGNRIHCSPRGQSLSVYYSHNCSYVSWQCVLLCISSLLIKTTIRRGLWRGGGGA